MSSKAFLALGLTAAVAATLAYRPVPAHSQAGCTSSCNAAHAGCIQKGVEASFCSKALASCLKTGTFVGPQREWPGLCKK